MPQVLFGVVLVTLLTVGWFNILRRLGWKGWWSVPMIVPFPFGMLAGSAYMYFQQWPLERRVAELEAEIARLNGE